MNGPLTFRKDITFVEQDNDNGHKTIVLKNPVSETFFRLSDYEFRLIKQFDGKKSFQRVLEALRSQGLSYEPRNAEAILAKASSAGLMLGSPLSDSDYLANLRHRINEVNRLRKYLSPISLYVPLGNPDRFLDKWLWIFNTLFSRYTLILWVSLGLYSVYVISGSLTRIHAQHLSLMNAWDLLMLWPAIAASRLIHEMGHALVAKRYGVRVKTIGIAVLFFFPLPYCDTTDAWKLKSQRQRIWIGAAGITAEMILACISSLIWFFSKPGTLNYSLPR
jgi:putative peptide zinc metalloprotease protein